MNKISAHEFYKNAIEVHERLLAVAKLRYRKLSMLRLGMFLLIALGVYMVGWNWLLIPLLIGGSGLFFVLVNRSLDAKVERQKEELYLDLNRKELAALAGDWSGFADGAAYRSGAHPYAVDMDVFGPKSVFQLINRTVLRSAGEKLAHTLAYGTKDVLLSNRVINDFSKHPEWMQRFIVEAQVRIKEREQQALDKLNELDVRPRAMYWLRWVLPALSFVALGIHLNGLIPFAALVVVLLLVGMVIGNSLRKSNRVILSLINRSEQLEAMIQQLELLQSIQPEENETQEYLNRFMAADGAYFSLNRLNTLRKQMEYRMNFLVGILLNVFLAWDFHMVVGFDQWRIKHGKQLSLWEDQLAQLEVWVSGGVYLFNHPRSVFAAFNEDDVFEVRKLGHPFVAADRQVTNDFVMHASAHFQIITGPNMAGKSTFLRSVGMAIISANAGFPVLAATCNIPRVVLYSSMRTSDDLTVESSYFHAELSRLRFIMDAIERGERTFIILDEILKGTNSKDKEIGSARFLEKLKRLGARGIIATHDLSLTKLSDGNTAFENWYFDSTIEGETLSFDYKMRSGVCQNMNASFLLRQMNLVDE